MQGWSESMTITKVIPLPSESMPVSWGIDTLISELEDFDVDTDPLRHSSQKLDDITLRASNALQYGDHASVYRLLDEAVVTLREAQLNLKLMCIMERNHLPSHVVEHLHFTREIIEDAMEDAKMTLRKKKTYSSTA